MKNTLINLGLFQLGWLACVLGGNIYAGIYTAMALLVHQWLLVEDPREWKLIFTIALVGCIWDMAMVQSAVIHYPDGIWLGIPPWLVCLWLLFATTFMHGLQWLRAFPWVAVLFAAVFGPASYWVGTSLTDARLHDPVLGSLVVMSLGWALLFPLGIFSAAKLISTPRRSDVHLA